MIYVGLHLTFICSVSDLALIKKSHTLSLYWFLQKFLLKKILVLLLVTGVTQFTTCWGNKFRKSCILFVTYVLFNKWSLICYSHAKVLRQFFVFRFNVEKNILLQEMVGGDGGLPLFFYGPVRTPRFIAKTKAKSYCKFWCICIRTMDYNNYGLDQIGMRIRIYKI